MRLTRLLKLAGVAALAGLAWVGWEILPAKRVTDQSDPRYIARYEIAVRIAQDEEGLDLVEHTQSAADELLSTFSTNYACLPEAEHKEAEAVVARWIDRMSALARDTFAHLSAEIYSIEDLKGLVEQGYEYGGLGRIRLNITDYWYLERPHTILPIFRRYGERGLQDFEENVRPFFQRHFDKGPCAAKGATP
ncbi:MAG: hypothetical protein AAGI70_03955 [Pseudomonadota bacterium]